MSEPRNHGLRLESYTISPLVNDPPETPEETAERLWLEAQQSSARIQYDDELTERIEADWEALFRGGGPVPVKLRLPVPIRTQRPGKLDRCPKEYRIESLKHLSLAVKSFFLGLALLWVLIFLAAVILGGPRP